MGTSLDGHLVAFLATDGVEQVELTKPWQAVQEAGGTPKLISIHGGTIKGFDGMDPADEFDVDLEVRDANPADYTGLVLPGGVANPDKIRMDDDALEFVRRFFLDGKPVGAICHGPWTLVEAGLVDGRTLTSFPSLKTDIRNAGGHWVDEPVHVDEGLVTSRTPDDLPAFCSKVVEELEEGRHRGQVEKTPASALHR